VGDHISTGEYEDHKVVKFQSRNSTPLYPECTAHDKERCEMYCNPCHIPVCVACVASDQHLGHRILKIMQVLEEKKEMIASEKNVLAKTIYPAYEDIVSDVQTNMSRLEMEYENLSTAITIHGEEWHREIDKFVQKLKAEVQEMKTTQLHTLQEYQDEVNKKISEINTELHSMDVALDSIDMSKVLSFMPNVDEYKKLPQRILPPLPQFTPGRIQEELCKLFGTLSIYALPEDDGYSINTTQESLEAASSVIKQLLAVPQNVTTMYTGYTFLYNVACLSGEEIWASGEDSAMKLYSINQGSLLKSITTKSEYAPWDIAVTNNGDLVYIDHDDRSVNIVKNEEIETVIRLQSWRPYDVCCTSCDDLLVTMDSDDYKQCKVVRYSGSTETQTIQFDDQGRPLYSYSPSIFFSERLKYISENKNLDICVTDYKSKVVMVVNQAGKVRFRYFGHTPAPQNKPFRPRGITTDSQSNIITADGSNHCVHIIDQDGQFLGYIDCGLSEPWGLCVDINDNLFVAQCGNKQIKKIKYQQ
jgi:hypothetical protein